MARADEERRVEQAVPFRKPSTMRFRSYFIARALSVILAFGALNAQPADQAELAALRAQVRQLEEQLQAIKARLDAKAGPPSPPQSSPQEDPADSQGRAAAAVISVNDRGYTLASADGKNVLQPKALIQVDGRFFFHDGGLVNDTWALRKARLIAEGKLGRAYGFQFITEFGGSAVSVLDANITAEIIPGLIFKAGKFKTPVGLEVLVPDHATTFLERTILSGFMPNRDIGIQLSGEMGAGRVSYTAGIFNGVADGANSTNADFDENKDFVGRVLVRPFLQATRSPWRGLMVGLAGSQGRQKTAAGRTAGYRTDGQQFFFTYHSGVVADGLTWRLAPQLDYRMGPLALMGEYVISAVNVSTTTGGPRSELKHRAWETTVSYVLTGEDSLASGLVPRKPFDLPAGTWGALEIVARMANARLADGSFPIFADPSTNASSARAIAVGLNWHWSKAYRVMINALETRFSHPPATPLVAPAPLLQHGERAIVSRLQFSF